MLDSAKLANIIKDGIEATFSNGFKCAMINLLPSKSPEAEEACEDFANTLVEIIAPSLSSVIAEAIDAYIKNGTITMNLTIPAIPTTNPSAITIPTPISATGAFILGNPVNQAPKGMPTYAEFGIL